MGVYPAPGWDIGLVSFGIYLSYFFGFWMSVQYRTFFIKLNAVTRLGPSPTSHDGAVHRTHQFRCAAIDF
jgi:hypothetical protein